MYSKQYSHATGTVLGVNDSGVHATLNSLVSSHPERDVGSQGNRQAGQIVSLSHHDLLAR